MKDDGILKDGIYEQVINKLISTRLSGDKRHVKSGPIDTEEAAGVLSRYISEAVEKGLSNIKDSGGDIGTQIDLVNNIIDAIVYQTKESWFDELTVDKRAELLLAILERKNNIHALYEKAKIIRPDTSISQSLLFTGARHEPSMFEELKKEILSCDRIDMLVSFIKWSGLRLIIEELKHFAMQGRLRIITTAYMGATDVKAVEELQKLPNTEIKISYDTKRTRLHAKTYVFYRNSGFSTAYVGSSNLSNAAISSGLEWNVKVTAKDLPDTIKKIDATFESYWNSNEFIVYCKSQKHRLESAIKAERNSSADNNINFDFDIAPYPFQQEILDCLEAERTVHNAYRNLVVSATGTGKTVISAFDYKRFCHENKGRPCRLLFVAHREEILTQSLSCFRGVLHEANFGELFVGSYRPGNLGNLFMSVQTFDSQDFEKKTAADFYDYIIVDEFHHAAAPTYQKLLTYYRPKIFLGLTATPERMDGKSIIEYFNNRIAAEIRLPEAIDRKLLCPFQYFGVTDSVDLNELRWTRGGYEKSELSKVYTGNHMRARMIIKALHKYVTDINEVKGLGFCVSVAHAEFMSDVFNHYEIPSIHLTASADDATRNTAKKRLINGEIRFIFVVDLYNEGVDIPEVNTLLFLRPTESLTVFLQQLGRGLRLVRDKECLTVLDFIGQANRKYSFEDKFAALLENTSKDVQREIKEGFISLPKGCFIQLERKAKEHILENIRSSFGYKTGIITRIAGFEEDSGKPLTLTNFLAHHHIDAKTIYATKSSFSRLCVSAGVANNFSESDEDLLTKSFGRICSIDSRRWLLFLLKIFADIKNIKWDTLTETEKRFTVMLNYTIYQKPVSDFGFGTPLEAILALQQNTRMFYELTELLKYCYEKIDFVDEQLDLGFACPLDLNCAYSRDQILVAFDFMNPSNVREGVKYIPEKKTDIFFVTLNKSEKDYSESTMYNDYSISENLFHWQSQSTTSTDSPTGQRYINHRAQCSKILLFVREHKSDSTGAAAPYTFLGPADYSTHTGSRPINIVWKLHKAIPAKYLKKTNKMVVG